MAMKSRHVLYGQRPNQGSLGEERVKRCIRLFRNLHGTRLLDIGCADGIITMALADALRTQDVFGVDIAPDAVAAARERGVKAIVCDLDAQDLPFEAESFDLIYCGECIEHVFDTDHLLREVRRVLRRGGQCVLTTPNLAGWPNRVSLLLGFQPYPTAASPHYEGTGKLVINGEEGQWGHIRVMTLRALLQLCRLHGFAIDKVEGCPVTINSVHWLVPVVRSLDRFMSRFPGLANRVIVVLRRG
jgi:methionine biosynthesis protein MetW